ncbi:MAG: M23 family metallopeptidase [Actinomycetaceae bacterium]|nr:M23 family metallopeptidase [Actinomycetaceae bacterium]
MTAHDASHAAHFPTRRELREQAELARKNSEQSGKQSKWFSLLKGGLVAIVAAGTVAVPVTGFVGPDTSLSLPAKATAMPVGQASWATAENSIIPQAEGLREVAAAASRAKLRTPLEVSQCLQVTPANGNRAVSESAPIVWPMLEGTFNMASPFGMRFHPVLGYSKLHEGIDLAGPLGTPIFAAADGVVVESHPAVGVGYWLYIKHQYADGETFYTAYAHMFESDVLVKAGDKVTAGQQIASVGNTGTSTGPHLHFEVHDKNDALMDPALWLADQDARQPGKGCE